MMEIDPNSPPYAGDALVSDDSYLRRLPVALLLKDRMRFDAIVTASDIIEQAFGALCEFTGQCAVEFDSFTNSGRAFALSQCWTIVDQLHAIRQLLPSVGKKAGPFSQAFREAAEVATRLRNRMDHLAANLDNLSKFTGSKPPLFGSLSYFYAPTAQEAERGGHLVTIMSGALHGQEVMPIVNPAGRQFTLPTGLFTLSAFGEEIEFGGVIGKLRDWIRRVEATIEADIKAQVVAHSSLPEDIDRGMATPGGGMTIIAAIDFRDEGHNHSD